MSDKQALTRRLSPAEQVFWERCLVLFALVEARQPEKGIVTLLAKAKKRSEIEGVAYEAALELIYTEAEIRTHRRVALLTQCSLDTPGY